MATPFPRELIEAMAKSVSEWWDFNSVDFRQIDPAHPPLQLIWSNLGQMHVVAGYFRSETAWFLSPSAGLGTEITGTEITNMTGIIVLLRWLLYAYPDSPSCRAYDNTNFDTDKEKRLRIAFTFEKAAGRHVSAVCYLSSKVWIKAAHKGPTFSIARGSHLEHVFRELTERCEIALREGSTNAPLPAVVDVEPIDLQEKLLEDRWKDESYRRAYCGF